MPTTEALDQAQSDSNRFSQRGKPQVPWIMIAGSSKVSPLMAWILDRASESVPAGIALPDVTPERLIALLKHHRVALALNIEGLGPQDLPNGTFEALTKLRRARAMRQLGIAGELRCALQALEASGVPALVLKGLANGALLHKNPLRRDALDIDILVPQSAFPKACEALSGLGYATPDPFVGAKSKDLVFSSARAFAAIELHRRLSHKRSLFPIDEDALFVAPTIVTWQGSAVPTLSRETAFVCAATHGLRHFWARLFWLLDIDAATRRHDIDWDQTFHLAEKLGTMRHCLIALVLARTLLRSPIPAPFNRTSQLSHAESLATQLIPLICGEEPLRDREIIYRMGLLKAVRLELSVQTGLLRKAHQLLHYLEPTDEDQRDGAGHPFVARLRRITRTAWLQTR